MIHMKSCPNNIQEHLCKENAQNTKNTTSTCKDGNQLSSQDLTLLTQGQ